MELNTEEEITEEITEEELAKIELALMSIEEELTGDEGPFPVPIPPSSEERMQNILKKAKLEVLAQEAADFAQNGVGSGVKGIIDTLLALKPTKSDDGIDDSTNGDVVDKDIDGDDSGGKKKKKRKKPR